MAEPDATPAPAAAPPPDAPAPTTAAPISFENAFKPQQGGGISFDQAFPPQEQSYASRGSSLIGGPIDSLIRPSDPDNYINWKDYTRRAPSGRIMAAFGEPFGPPAELAPETTEWLRKHGVFNDEQAAHEDHATTFAGTLFRPAVNAMRGLNEALFRPPIETASNLLEYGILRPFSGLLAGVAQAGKEAQQTRLGSAIGAEKLATDIAGEIERRGTVGDLGDIHAAGPKIEPQGTPTLPEWANRAITLGGVDRTPLTAKEAAVANYADIDHTPLPGVIAAGRANAVIGEGEAGYFGTKLPTEQDLAERRAAAADVPPPPETPPTIHDVARQIAPETFESYDALVARKESYNRWLGELRDQRDQRLASEGHPDVADLDKQIADLERKSENAGARLQKRYGEQLDDLYDRRAEVLSRIATTDSPDMATVRQALVSTDQAMRDLAPDVSAAYRAAAERLPETEVLTAEESAPRPTAPVAALTEAPVAGPVQEPGAVRPENAPLEPPPTAGNQATVDHFKAIADDVTAKLQAVGHSAEQARAEAMLVANYYDTWSKRMGGVLGTAQEMFERDGFDVVGHGQRVRALARELAQGNIARSVDTPEFKEWFGKSKMVDAKGAPIRFYHGTPNDVDVIQSGAAAGHPFENHGIYFSSSADLASRYAFGVTGAGQRLPNVLPVYLRLENPKVIGKQSIWDRMLGRVKVGSRRDMSYDTSTTRITADDMERLKAEGYDGIVNNGANEVIIFDSAQAKSIHNRGTFDPNNPKILEQSNRGGVRHANPAMTALDEGRKVIRLLKSHDASTFMHEVSHTWLGDLLRYSEHPLAPADVKADAETVKKWLGVNSLDDLKATGADGKFTKAARAANEKWATGWERYLMEGTAPSKALARVFAQFRNWLTSIYRTVVNGKAVDTLKAEISPEIRDVFDRMLAKEPERTVIAPEREAEGGLGAIHETDAAAAHPAVGEAVGDRMHGERVSDIKTHGPELTDELGIDRGAEAGTGTAPREGADGGGAAAEPQSGAASPVPGVGAVSTGGGGAAPAGFGPPQPAKLGPTKESALYAKVPKRPPSLADWIKKRGGVRDDGGDVTALGVKKPGLIKATGESTDELARAAEEAGFFPEKAGERPTVQEFLRKLDDDLHGNHQWSEHQAEEVEEYRSKQAHNAEVDRIASDLEIETKGLSHSEFWDKVAERKSVEDQAREVASQDAAGELADDALDRIYPEAEADTAGEAGSGDEGAGGPGRAARGAASGEGVEGQRGGRARPAGGDATAQPEPGAIEPDEPTSAHTPLPVDDEQFVDKAGNFRLENINTGEDAKEAIRQAVDRNQGFIDQRRGVMTHEETLRIADAAGMSPGDLDSRGIGQAFNAEEIVKLERLFIQAATAVGDAAKAAKAAGLTDESLMALGEAEARQRMILDYVAGHAAGVRAEAGRALNIFNALKKMEGHAEAHAIADILKEGAGLELNQLRRRAIAYAAARTPAQIAGEIVEMNKPSLGDMALEVFKNWLISGPLTHLGYGVGNAMLALYKALPETAAQAAAGAIREAITGEVGNRRYFGEIMPQLYGLYYGQRQGWRAAYDSFISGQTMALPHEALDTLTKAERAKYDVLMSRKGTTHEEALRRLGVEEGATTPYTNTGAVPNFKVGGIPIPLGSIVRSPGERMVAPVHSYFRTIGYIQSVAAQSARIAIDEGLTGQRLANRIAELQLRPSEEVMKIARGEATQQTLMGRGAGFTQKMSSLINHEYNLPFAGKTKALAFFDPFVRVQSNIIEQGALQRGPLGLLSSKVRDDLMGRNGALEQTTTAGKLALGTSLMGVWAGLELEGVLQPSAPHDPKEAAVTTMVNGIPHSVRIGDMTFEVSRLGPMGWQAGLAADMAYAIRTGMAADKDQLGHIASLLVLSFAHNFVAEGAMKGPSDLLKSVDDPERFGANYARNLFASFAVPFSVGMGQIAHQIDPYAREARTLLDEMKAKVPGLSETLKPRRDVWGEQVPNREWAGVYMRKVQQDPVNQELLRMGIFPAKVSRKIRGVELTDDQYDEYANVAGHLAKESLDDLVGRESWAAKPGHVKVDQIRQRIKDARKKAQNLVMAHSVGTDNDIHALALENKNDLTAKRDIAGAGDWEP